MSDKDVSVRIGADTSGLKAGAAESIEQVERIRAATAGLANGFGKLNVMVDTSFTTMKLMAKEAAESVTWAAEAVAGLREMMSGLGEAVLAAFAVEAVIEFAKKMGETAEQIIHTGQTFGLTAEEVQRLKAEAAGAGIPFEALTGSFGRLDKAMAAAKAGSTQQANAFKTIGVDVNQAYTQAELFRAVMSGLAGMDAGPAKIAAAMAILRRNIQTIGPLIGLSREQLADLDKQAEAYGATSDDAVEKGGALAESFNTGNVAMQGLGNTMTSALAPALTLAVQGFNELVRMFVDSYKHGGLAKTVMDALAGSIKVVETVAVLMGAQLAVVTDIIGDVGKFAVSTFADAASAVWKWADNITGLGEYFEWLKGIAAAAIEVVIGWIKKAATAVMDWLNSIPGVEAFLKKTGQVATDVFSNVTKDAARAADAVKKIWGPDQKVELPKAGTGTTDEDPGAKGAKGGKGRMAGLENGLSARIDTDSGQGAILVNEKAEAVRYWAEILAGEAQNSTDRAAIQKKLWDATRELRKQDAAEARQDQNADAAAATAAVNAELATKKVGITEQIAAIKEAEQTKQISVAEGNAKIKGLLDQEVSYVQAAEDQKYQIRVASDLKAMAGAASDTKEYKDAYRDLAKAFQDMETAKTAASIDGAKKRNAVDLDTDKQAAAAMRRTADSWRETVKGMIEGTTSWAQVVSGIADKILDKFLSLGEDMLLGWLKTEAGKSGATAAGVATRATAEEAGQAQTLAASLVTSLKQIANSAATAAAGAYNAFAGIPVIGPELGAAAAAATFAAVMGFQAMASAAGGYDIPSGVNPLTQLHAQEMVLPANLAVPLRASIASGALSPSGGLRGGGGAGGAGGDTYHVHLHMPVTASGSADMKRWVKTEGGPHILDQIAQGIRTGQLNNLVNKR